MSDGHSDLPKLPLRLSATQVLGLKDTKDGDWSRLRSLQYASLYKEALARAVANAGAVLVAISIYSTHVHGVLLFLWSLAQLLVMLILVRIDRKFASLDGRPMRYSEFCGHLLTIGALAALWGFALLDFVPQGGMVEHFALWAIVAMLVAGASATLNPAPASPALFAFMTGIAGTISFVIAGEWYFVAVCAAFACIAVGSAISTGRVHLAARIAEVGVAEKSEVVSLLLREHEANEADWLWQIDINRKVRSPSSRFAYALGRDRAAIEGVALLRLIAGDSARDGAEEEGLRQLAENLKRRENFSDLLVQVQVPNGNRWWQLSGAPIVDEKGIFRGFRGVGSDVTAQRDRDEKIAYLARYDTLSGLPNRLMLTEALGDALRYCEHWKSRCAFLMIDLDRFKSINDSLGHQMGDRLLAKVAQRLASVLGEGEMCGRLGGDEFAVVIRDAGKIGDVARLCEAIITSLSKPYNLDHHTLFIGASVGSAIGPRDGATVETLMRNADLALYRAKDEGGNVHFSYVPSLHAEAEERRVLEGSLRRAIANDELQLNFQPVVDAVSEDVVSFEALLRWNSSEHGMVSPAKFIPLAEDTRLIVPIGNWVLQNACLEAAKWPTQVKIAVNVSGEQLLEPAFAEEVVRALAESGLAPQRLEVEVTESVFLRDGRTARETLEKILALGCTVALDDFGTGYSSLGYLRSLRFSTIKVDRSFVLGASEGSQESVAIINAVIAMARSLGMTTTAEGVEDQEQARMIRDLGCNKIQGYYFGRPMAAEDARKLLRMKREAA